MGNGSEDAEVRAIEAVIARQFRSLTWAPGAPGDWEGFAAGFLPGAALFPAARPARAQTPQAFVERMQGLAQTTLQALDETLLGTRVHVFGNLAVALAGNELLENGTTTTRAVEAFLLIKDQGAWRIATQAWDVESEANPIPAELGARR